MEIVLVVLAALVVLVVALVAVGTITSRLASEPPRRVFDNDEVVSFIAEALPSHLTAVMSFDDVQRIQRLHLDYLHAFGLARSGGDLRDAEVARLLEEDEATAWIVDRAAAQQIRLEPDQVRAVIDAQLAYFEAIGAIDELTDDEADVRDVVTSEPADPEPAGPDGAPSVNGESHVDAGASADPDDDDRDGVDPAAGSPSA
ncbi:MAG: hypothetical protein S0880_20835 [Actinomycetota bacterium]|nr:hypothetical protein [Actinomycetota bacterium]